MLSNVDLSLSGHTSPASPKTTVQKIPYAGGKLKKQESIKLRQSQVIRDQASSVANAHPTQDTSVVANSSLEAASPGKTKKQVIIKIEPEALAK